MKAIISTIEKNSREEIRVEITEYKGHDLVGVRVYADSQNCDERIPTPKGITLGVHLIPQLIEALKQAQSEAIKAGLVM